MASLCRILLAIAVVSCGARQAAVAPVCAVTGAPGPLQFPLRTDGACLVDAAGAPVWLHGEAAWSLLVRLDDAELDRYLADRRARGTNALLVNLVEHKFTDRAPDNRAGDAPFTVPGDFSTPNEAYFAHVDRALARVAAAGMAVLLAPAYLGYKGGDEGWYAEIRRSGPAKLRAYGRFLGARYRAAPNLVWVEGGDAPPMKAGDEIDALVAGIRETDPVHLHTAHSTRHRSALDDYDRPWLGINTTYSDCGRHGDALQGDALRPRTIPTLFIEGSYENEEYDGQKASLGCTIAQPYRALLSGAAGYMFGNRPLWLFDPGWPAALDSPGSRVMQSLAKLIAEHDLRGMVPDFDGAIATAGPGHGRIAAARSAAGAVVVFVEQGPRMIHVAPGAKPAPRTARWFDPVTGAISGAVRYAPGEPITLTCPAGAWILLVEDAAAPR